MGATTRWVLARVSREMNATPGPMPAAWQRSVWDHFDQGTQRAILRLYRSAPPQRLARAGEHLSSLHAPALVLWGEQDPYIPARFAEAYGAVLPNAEVRHAARRRTLAVARPPRARRAGRLLPRRRLTVDAACACGPSPLATIAPWRLGVAVSAPLSLAYLVIRPPSADLAAATYRSDVFARAGFTLWDNGWYGGHHVPGYSLFAPALGALITPRGCLAVAGIAAAGLFGALAARGFPPVAARAATAWFAVAVSVELVSGRVPYDLGVVTGLGALLALAPALERAATRLPNARLALALGLAALTSLTSPVAGAFVALAGVAIALATPARGYGLALAAAALVPVTLLQIAFPEGGYEPFAPSAFWPAFVTTLVAGALFARDGRRLLAVGAGLYALASLGAFATHTAMGGNVERLGALIAGPLLVGALWGRRAVLLALLVPVLAYWSLVASVRDLASLVGDPSVHAAYYAPLLGELAARAHGRPLRVEIPLTGAHWESAYVAERYSLARGWERQLDTRYGALFYGTTLSPAAYHAWLRDNAVAYVAVPDVRLDSAGRQEARLVAAGLPYLSQVWRSAHWRLYAVRDAAPLASAPATLTALGNDGFALALPRAATVVVRVRYTPYWAIVNGRGCVAPAGGGWTQIASRAPGRVVVGIRFALTRIGSHATRCVV